MHEQTKLKEAKYFCSRLAAEYDNREAFNYNLSAFLGASRSVLQYALEEAKIKQGGQQWYDTTIAQSQLLSFFRDKRDVNVHAEPVKSVQHISVSVSETIHISASVSITHRDAKGNILYQSPPQEPKHKRIAETLTPPAKTETQYRFSDWNGTEDIMTLCKMYLEELQHIVDDGINNGFITE
ncbi:hypothetical protein ACFLVE_02265 [Chloroflexota bacterium]